MRLRSSTSQDPDSRPSTPPPATPATGEKRKLSPAATEHPLSSATKRQADAPADAAVRTPRPRGRPLASGSRYLAVPPQVPAPRPTAAAADGPSLAGSFPAGFAPGAPRVPPSGTAFLRDWAFDAQQRLIAEAHERHNLDPLAPPDPVIARYLAAASAVVLTGAQPMGEARVHANGARVQRFGAQDSLLHVRPNRFDHELVLTVRGGDFSVAVQPGRTEPTPAAEQALPGLLATVRQYGWDRRGDGTGVAYLETASLLNDHMKRQRHGEVKTLPEKSEAEVDAIGRSFLRHVGEQSFPGRNLPGTLRVMTKGVVEPAPWPRRLDPLRMVDNPLGLNGPEQILQDMAALGTGPDLGRYIDLNWQPLLAVMSREDVMRVSEHPLVHQMAATLGKPAPGGLDMQPLDVMRIARHRFGMLSLTAIRDRGPELLRSGMSLKDIADMADHPEGFEALSAELARRGIVGEHSPVMDRTPVTR